MGLVTFIVENILKECDVDQNRVSAIKVSKIDFTMFYAGLCFLQTGLCQSVNPAEVIYTRIWEEEGLGLEKGFSKLYFAASGHMSGKPVVTGISISINIFDI